MIYLLLFWEFLKIGLFTFGGGYAMIPLLKEAVMSHSWLTEAQFYDFIGVCESTPGPIAVNMATYVGSVQGGILGGAVATCGVVLPSFIIILLIASVLMRFTENKYFKNALKGINPVVMGLILGTGLLLLAKQIGYQGKDAFSFDLGSTVTLAAVVIFAFLYKTISKKSISAVLLIVISAVLGLGINWLFSLSNV
ncbi:MAG: chromate transporter [Bacilli bacterium]|jgi:chromate transporter|nr:chromate transporter [Bacilli bacterium]